MADDQRHQRICLDNDHRQENVELARKFIFEKGLGIKSKGVEPRPHWVNVLYTYSGVYFHFLIVLYFH